MTASSPADPRFELWRLLTPVAESGPEGVVRRRFVMIPGRSNPRWYLPVDSRRHAAVAAGVIQTFRPVAQAAAGLLQLAAWGGVLRMHPARLEISFRPALEALLSDLVGSLDLRLAIHAGRSAQSRAMVTVAGVSRRKVEAFARMSLRPEGESCARRELEALSFAHSLGARVPEVLWTGEVAGCHSAVQRAVRGSRSPLTWTGAHERLVAGLEHGAPRPLTESTLIRKVCERVRTDPVLAVYLPLLDGALEVLGSVSAAPVLNHRDLAPWNLLQHGAGDLVAIDWEFGEPDGIPHLDRFAFELAVGVHLRRWKPDRLARYSEAWCDTLQFPRRESEALLALLLLERLTWRIHEQALSGDRMAEGCRLSLAELGRRQVRSLA